MKGRETRIWIAAVVAILLASVGACNCNRSTPTASENDSDEASKEAKANPTESGDKGGDESGSEQKGDPPPTDLYPGMNFGKLDADERRKFVSIAKAELCPCPNSTESMHECLQKPDGQCTMAKSAATVIARGIGSGLSQEDVLDKLADFIEKSKKEYEFDLEGTPHKGPPEAPVTVVEFADFECPHCKRATKMMDELVEKYGDKVVLYFKHFPLSGHDKARLAAQAAAAAHIQGKFWPMHDLLFKHQRSLSKDKISRFARRLGLNFSKFEKDMSGKGLKVVRQDRKEGLSADITGTPAIFVNGRHYVGPLTKKGLSDMIEAAMERESGE